MARRKQALGNLGMARQGSAAVRGGHHRPPGRRCWGFGIGLPLTIGLGTLLALALFHGMSFRLALLVGAALAPTDAALGAGMMAASPLASPVITCQG